MIDRLSTDGRHVTNSFGATESETDTATDARSTPPHSRDREEESN
jgi:hypothetical protein